MKLTVVIRRTARTGRLEARVLQGGKLGENLLRTVKRTVSDAKSAAMMALPAAAEIDWKVEE